LIVANGFPDDLVDQVSHQVTYREPLLLFRNDGRSFRDVSRESGPVFSKSFPARGLALGDFNNDGAVDVLVSNNDAPPLLLVNNAAKNNHWLGVRLIGRKCNVDAIGARLSFQAGDLKRSHMKVGGGSFLSSHDPRIVLGIGSNAKVNFAEVRWPPPSGLVQRFTNLPVDRYITIVEGREEWQ
jgi:enediyne biosynthesis protein E4